MEGVGSRAKNRVYAIAQVQHLFGTTVDPPRTPSQGLFTLNESPEQNEISAEGESPRDSFLWEGDLHVITHQNPGLNTLQSVWPTPASLRVWHIFSHHPCVCECEWAREVGRVALQEAHAHTGHADPRNQC